MKKKNTIADKKIITVKNAEGDADTTAEIVVPNQIDYTPKISVIIPVYNVEQYLRQCLDSVVNQTLREIEIICVDDGSTDSSLDILREYAANDKRVTVLKQENLHAGVARNAGLAIAKGEYLSFLDSDDFFELNMLEDVYRKAEHEKADIVMFNTYLYDEQQCEDKEVNWTLKTENLPEIFNYKDVPNKIFNLSNCWVWNRLYNRSFIKQSNLHFQNTAFSNDIYFSCMTMVLASKICYLNNRLCHYRTNQTKSNNITSDNYRLKYPTASLQCFQMLFQKLNAIKIYEEITESFLSVCTQNLYWSMQCMLAKEESFKEFTDYFITNLKNIYVSSKFLFSKSDLDLNRKYTALRNILVENGVFDEIPQRIFYVWGAHEPKKDKVSECINSWKKHLPNYEIAEINEESVRYFDFQKELKENRWFRTVYNRKMWAYVADYIRIKAIADNGGIYFDTDVSVVQNMDKFLSEPAFVGIQSSSVDGTGDWVEPAICGAKKNNALFRQISAFYDEKIWQEPIYTMPHIFNYFLRQYDIFPFPAKSAQKIIHLPDITIYPERYFIPYRFREEYTPACIEPETHTIHWWGGSWVKPEIVKFLQNKHTIFHNIVKEHKHVAKPKISVIIPVYNVELYLAQCLDSIINQTFDEIEIICVNDGSPDDSLKILKEYAAKDKRIVVIDQENQGLSCSRNNALKIAKGEYILFLDSDDYIRADACEVLYKKSKENNLDMLNFAGTNFKDGDTQFFQYKSQTMFYLQNGQHIYNPKEIGSIMKNIPISACRFFYRRQFLNKNEIRFPEGINFEDNYFVRKALIFVQKYGAEDEILYFRRVHNASITQNEDKFFKDYIEVVRRVEELYRKHNVDILIIRDVIQNYCVALYAKFSKFSYSVRSRYRPKLFSFLTAMNQRYIFDKTRLDLQSIIAKELTRWAAQFKIKPNLDSPRTFNEKIQWLKLYDSTPIKTRLADKYLVRDWVKEKIGEEYLIPLLGVYDKFEDIDFAKLPDKFVIKCNHGCSYNIIVKDKSQLDLTDVKAKLDKWMNENYAFHAFELHYRDIQPKIIIEKYIENAGTNDLYDYKLWCFNGKVYYIQFLSERNLGGLKMAFYNRKWQKQKFVYSYPLDKKDMPKPNNLQKMILLAEKLSQGFNHTRVDFYRMNDGKLYFGEMTFTSASGICKWNDENTNRYFGSLITLPKLAYNIDTGEYYKLPKDYHKKLMSEMQNQQGKVENKHVSKRIISYKLFNFIPLLTYKQRGGRQVWKILGLPVWKVRKMADNTTTKYYLFGIPLLKTDHK
ncbi:MAG: glycosyltransferase [Alphaproteobacteria bacterium]|nr:glycosyltransferase [Alphaproteobacteria bacterium]